MQKTRILWNNLWRQGTILAKTTESPQFPAIYTQDDDTTLPWRSTSCAAYQEIDIDLGATCDFNYVALLNHNITSGATIAIYGSANSGFSPTGASDAITFNANNMRYYLGTTWSYRYVRIRVTNTGNPAGYIKIGTIVLGKYLDLGVVVSGEGYEDGLSDETQIEYSPSRNLFITQSKPVLISRPMSHTHLTDAVKDSILQLLRACGHHYAMDFCLDYTAPNTYSTWAVLTEAARCKYVHANHWRWDIEILEHV